MSIRTIFMIAATAAFTFTAPLLANACEGTVYGLSGTYNLAKGNGFLAIRASPTSKSRMIGQAFNDNIVQIEKRSGNWLLVYVDTSQKYGWVHARYVRRDCDGL